MSYDYANGITGLTNQNVIYENIVLPEDQIGAQEAARNGITATEQVVTRNAVQEVVGYVSDWAQYSRAYNLESIDPTAYTKLVLSFAGIVGDRGEKSSIVQAAADSMGFTEHQMTPLDGFGDFQSAISQRQLDMGWNDLYDSMTPDKYANLNPSNVRGLVGQMLWLKGQNPSLKLAVSIGGWTLSEPFHRMAADPVSRGTFNDSVIDFIKKWGFDGVDIDWEYPGVDGNDPGASTPQDGDNLVLLIQDLRLKLDSNNLSNVEITIAAGATREHIEAIGQENYEMLLIGKGGVPALATNANVMTYDFWGAFSWNLSHMTNLHSGGTPKIVLRIQ
jgi:GH18 family chitinase